MRSLQSHTPHIIVAVGLPSAGKSFFAGKFSDTFNAPYLNYNLFRWRVGDDKAGEEIADHVLDMLFKTKQTILIEGRGSKLEDRQDLAKLARKNGYNVLYVWVQTEPAIAKRRATNNRTGGMTTEEFDNEASQFEPFKKNEPYVVISGKHTHATQAKVVLKRLVSERPITPILQTSHTKISRHIPLRGRVTR